MPAFIIAIVDLRKYEVPILSAFKDGFKSNNLMQSYNVYASKEEAEKVLNEANFQNKLAINLRPVLIEVNDDYQNVIKAIDKDIPIAVDKLTSITEFIFEKSQKSYSVENVITKDNVEYLLGGDLSTSTKPTPPSSNSTPSRTKEDYFEQLKKLDKQDSQWVVIFTEGGYNLSQEEMIERLKQTIANPGKNKDATNDMGFNVKGPTLAISGVFKDKDLFGLINLYDKYKEKNKNCLILEVSKKPEIKNMKDLESKNLKQIHTDLNSVILTHKKKQSVHFKEKVRTLSFFKDEPLKINKYKPKPEPSKSILKKSGFKP